MVPLDLFHSRPVVIALSVGFAFMGGYYGMVFLFSLYYQQQRGLTPLGTGLAFLPMTLLIALTSVVAGRGPRSQRRTRRVYRSNYQRYSAATLDRVTSPGARSTTIELVPC
jgi:hypothetical protein